MPETVTLGIYSIPVYASISCHKEPQVAYSHKNLAIVGQINTLLIKQLCSLDHALCRKMRSQDYTTCMIKIII